MFKFEISKRNAKPIGVYLVEAGLITPAQVETALKDQKAEGKRLGAILADRGWVKPSTIEYLIKKVVLPERRAVENELSAPQKNRSQNLILGGQAILEEQKNFDSLLLSAVPSGESKFLDQLVYTSLPGVGFKVITSPQVSTQIQQAFLEQVVYQHWDCYNPPRARYRAAYLHQVTIEHTLFGWLYNDGVDDLGRRHTPYFLCYHTAELLHAVQLENIFTCLHKGPAALIDRQSLPATLETIIAPDLWTYQPARKGVAIPTRIREYSYINIQQRKLLKLFFPVAETEILTKLNN